MYSSVFSCIFLYSLVFSYILLYSPVFSCIPLYSPVFPCHCCCIISRLSEFCIGHFMPYYMPVGLINGHLVCYYMMYCAGPRASKPCWLSTLNYRVCSICLSFLCIVYNTKLQHGDPDVRITLLRYFQALTKQQKGTSALF